MPIIQNISKKRILSGEHISPEMLDCDLIQITDVATFPPNACKGARFNRIVSFDFADNDDIEDGALNEDQATEIVKFLMVAKECNRNVVVHCNIGISRSGAIVEFAVRELGFSPANEKRQPNQHVTNMLIEVYKNILKNL